MSAGQIDAAPSRASFGLGLDGDPGCFIFDRQDILGAVALQNWPLDMRSNRAQALAKASVVLERWLRHGLPNRHAGGIARFDFGHTLNFMRQEGLAGRDPVYRQATAPISRYHAGDQMTLPPVVDAPVLHSPRRYSISLVRELHIGHCAAGARLRLRLPMPYADQAQSEISIEPRLTGAEGEIGVPQPGRLDFLVRAPGSDATVTLAAKITLTLHQQQGGTSDIDPADNEIYLRPREGLIQITAGVEELARRLAGHLSEPREILQAFWRFFFSDLRLGYIRHHELDAADPLMDMVRRGWFDCLGGGALLIALARSRGIPARLIHGICPSESAPSFHYWIEVWLEDKGWLPIDLMCWDFAEGRPNDPWSDLLFGRLGYRVKCQRFPRIVTGPIGVKLPRKCAWMLAPSDGGAMMSYYNIEGERLVYRDCLQVLRLS